MSEFFINPYNFIPYGGNVERKPRNEETASEPLLTGEIKCSLTVKTPLAIPDAEERFMSKEKEDHYIYPFMTAGGVPIIPGSEIRGMVRNVYEMITNSCFSIINCNTLSKRDSKALPEAGLLWWDDEFGEWLIYEADVHNKLTQKGLDELEQKLQAEGRTYIIRTWTLFSSKKKEWERKGFLNKTIFVKRDSYVPVEEEKVDILRQILEIYKEYDEGSSKQFDRVMPEKDGRFYPVFFDTEDTDDNDEIVNRLTPAQISRSIFGQSVESLLGQTGHSPCTDTKNLCPACRLFGTVSQSGGGAVSSKLRFSDAVGTDVTLYPAKMDNEEAVPTLKELSSPKLTSIEFYSLLRNMTGYRDQQRWDYDSDSVYLRGRKIYLHNPKAAVTSEEEIKHAVFCTSGRTKRNASMQLATGGTFAFSVYFNGITVSELKTLVWALTLGDAEGNSSLHHKLGHGRPLGLGSVKLKVSEIFKRTTDGVSYATSSETVKEGYFDGFNLLLESDTLTALKAAFDFDYMANLPGNQHVAYPIGRKGSNARTSENTMQWFSQNHAALGNNGKYRYVLHPIVKNGRKASVSDLLLPYLSDEAAGGNASGGQGGNGGQQPAGGQRNNGSQQRVGGNHGGNHGNSRGNAPVTLHPGEESDAVITFIKKSGNKQIFINFDAKGTPGSLHESKFPDEIRANPEGAIGKVIRVKYLRTDSNGYNKFDLISQ